MHGRNFDSCKGKNVEILLQQRHGDMLRIAFEYVGNKRLQLKERGIKEHFRKFTNANEGMDNQS